MVSTVARGSVDSKWRLVHRMGGAEGWVSDAVCTGQRLDIPMGTGSVLEVSGATVLCSEDRRGAAVAAGVTCESG